MDDVPSPIDRDFLVEHHAWVFELARRLVGDGADAADVAQDTLTIALTRAVPGERTPTRWRAWLHTVARRVAGGRRRSEVRRALRQARAAAPVEGLDPAALVARRELAACLLDALSSVPEPYRSAVRGRHLEHREYADLARRAGLTEAALRQRVARGLQLLRERLDDPHERSGWLGLLLGATVDGAPPSSSPSGWLTGGVLMAKNTGLMAAAVVLASLTIWWWSAERPSVAQQPQDSADEVASVSGPGAVARPGRGPAREVTDESPAFDDRDPAERDSRVRVRDATGAPLIDAVLRSRTDAAAESAHAADDRGEIEVPRTPFDGVVVAPGHHPRFVSEAGDLVLTAGRSVAGRVELEGEGTMPGLRLRTTSGAPDLPAPWNAAEWAISVGPGGAFRSPALPDDWTGRLVLDPEYELVEASGGRVQGDGVVLLERREDIRLVVRAHTRIRLEVRWDDGTPAARASVHALVSEVGRDRARLVIGETGEDGHVELQPPTLERGDSRPPGLVTFTVYPWEGGEPLERTYGVRDEPLPAELEALVVPRGRRVEVVARTTEGGPLAGVHSTAPGARAWRTDADGRAWLRLLPETTSVRLQAFGFHPQVLEIPEGVDRLDVTFDAATTIRLEPARRELGTLSVFVRVRDADEIEFQGAAIARSQAPAGRQVVGLGRLAGGAAISGLEPGEQVEVWLADGLGHRSALELVTAAGAPDASGAESRGTPIGADVVVFDWGGRVVRESGAPMAGAHVSLWSGVPADDVRETRVLRTATDVEGRYRFGPFLRPVEGAHVGASHPGHLDHQETGVRVESGGMGPELVLRPGRAVEVRLTYPDGQPVPARWIHVWRGDQRFLMASRAASGRYELPALPLEPFEARARVNGATVVVPLPVGEETVTAHVPFPGRVSAAIERGEAVGLLQLRLRRDGEGHPLTARVESDGSAALTAAQGEWIAEVVRVAPGADGMTSTPVSAPSRITVVERGELELYFDLSAE